MPNSQQYLFDAPGTYRIRVRGHLDSCWSDTFRGMAIQTRRGRGKDPVTTLTGELVDQPSLMGVLTALYEMGYTLLDVKRLAERPDSESQAAVSTDGQDAD
jgi:hypothetical protein